ncbi:hypothetical protein [Terribacillus saccharophilus]|uniref:Uncharacterized protein n=1 Tax=Terribacillus saccharophilus TaxID=361277 RepID=A0ABX4GW76_9BACI|nr:hypothetical protein [Terribacillus saccharophilus]PAD34805.1 hypothetical protein CHH56_13570 [Terribacillus saccharophilus]PAD95551.1 hypothetical protein CHH50_13805 [Terribacillus saccharophilus]PAD99130.1 hypothetical protein CHH48_14700 [Terribacillus saccharophilus]
MINMAKVKKLDANIEEEVTLEVNNIEFTAFAFICPYKIELEKSYPVLIGFTILDDLLIREYKDNKKDIERIDTGYEYYLRGLLQRDSVDAGIVINDEDEYFSEYPELIGKNVELKVDRISVEFLKRE